MAQVIHISEEEASRDVKALFERVRCGEQLVVESSDKPAVMMTLSTEFVKARSVTGIIEALEKRKEAHRLTLLDGDFAADVKESKERYKAPRDYSRPLDATAAPSASFEPGRTAEEIIERLAAWEAKHGKITLDEEFVSDMEEIHRLYNEPLDDSKWG